MERIGKIVTGVNRIWNTSGDDTDRVDQNMEHYLSDTGRGEQKYTD